MLVIRFLRVGKKKQPSYKIVVTDKKNPPRAGRFVEQVGFYNPLTKEKILKGERIKYWLSVGAKASDTVYNLLVKEQIIQGKKIPKHREKSKGKESLDQEIQSKGEEAKEKIDSETQEKKEETTSES
jgi:small subunit ribosomal protein S16